MSFIITALYIGAILCLVIAIVHTSLVTFDIYNGRGVFWGYSLSRDCRTQTADWQCLIVGGIQTIYPGQYYNDPELNPEEFGKMWWIHFFEKYMERYGRVVSTIELAPTASVRFTRRAKLVRYRNYYIASFDTDKTPSPDPTNPLQFILGGQLRLPSATWHNVDMFHKFTIDMWRTYQIDIPLEFISWIGDALNKEVNKTA